MLEPMNKITLFNFKGNQIRMVIINDKPYFKASDVALAIGYKNNKSTISNIIKRHVDNKYKVYTKLSTPGGMQKTIVISESGVYQMATLSKLPSAFPFQRWIYEEVLPSIRKNGYYSVNEQNKYYIPRSYSEALRLAAKQAEQITVMKPKSEYYDRQMKNPGLIKTTTIAKEFGMSGRRLNKFLHEQGVIYKCGNTWYLYQKYTNKGYANYEHYSFDGDHGVNKQLKWTSKGEALITKLMTEHGFTIQIDVNSNMPADWQ